jgi:CubicO group peptidase (beta-lactamase class C family)
MRVRWSRASLLLPICVLAATALRGDAPQATRAKVEAALPMLEQLAQHVIERKDVPGMAIAVVHRDEVVYLKGFGQREVGKPGLVDGDTVFQLASLSKPISATVVAALVSEGKVGWDTRIAAIDPGFELHDAYPTAEVTIRDLFAHRSGLWGDAGNDIESLGYTRDQILGRLKLLKPGASFRARYAYSNFGLTEGAVAAARTASMSWEDLAEAKLFGPLGMSSTSFRHRDFLARTNRASLHVPVDGAWSPRVKRDPDAQAPAGGASSGARDLAQWVRLQLAEGKLGGTQLISSEAIGETHLPLMLLGKNPISGEPSFYGLGWGIDSSEHGTRWSHSGAFSAGARTAVDMLPAEQLGIVILCNAFPSGVPEGIAASFYDFVFEGKLSQDWVGKWNEYFSGAYGARVIEAAAAPFAKPPASPSPALPPAAYVGTYENAYVGPAVVSQRGDALTLTLGLGEGITFPLKHFDRDLFLFFPSEEAPTLPYAVRFAIGPDQVASAVTIDAFNENGQGVLLRTSKR